jgi:hypothetical protein
VLLRAVPPVLPKVVVPLELPLACVPLELPKPLEALLPCRLVLLLPPPFPFPPLPPTKTHLPASH